jgi:hypothetical protein
MLANAWLWGAVQGLSPVWLRFSGGNASKWAGEVALGMLANVWLRVAVQGLSPVSRRFSGGNASKWAEEGALGMPAIERVVQVG